MRHEVTGETAARAMRPGSAARRRVRACVARGAGISRPIARRGLAGLLGAALAALLAGAAPCSAQVAPAATPADTPSIKVGATIFADYTVTQQPTIKDAGGDVTLSAFQIGRSYINVTGNISHSIAFRVTPDIARETGGGSSLSGSYTFRLKYAYAQWNLDDHMTKGSFARFGMQPTPWLEFFDSVYRYRFQGPAFEDREGFLSSADTGASFHYNLPENFGDVQVGAFNGEGYMRAEVNAQKSLQMRGTVRPLPSRAVLRGLRLTAFWDRDAYAHNADRRRAIAGVTFEHPRVHAAFNYLATKDQTSATTTATEGRGWSAFVTPRTARGWEGLLRFDRLEPSKASSAQTKQRRIAGVSYWFPHQGNVATAVLFDVDNTTFDGFSPAQATQRKIAVHALVNF